MSGTNGGFERFGHEGDAGREPTLWALGIGVPTLIVGIMALSVYFVRPTADSAVLRMQRLKFHVAAWLFGMVVLTPLWALIEWQGQRRLRAVEQQQPARRLGSLDPDRWRCMGARLRRVVRRAAGVRAAHRRSVTFAREAAPARAGAADREGGIEDDCDARGEGSARSSR